MESNGITTQVKIYSHSALHSFITGSQPAAQKSRSQLNPYRRRQGLFAFLGINEVLEQVKREEKESAAPRAVVYKPEADEQPVSWNLAQVSEA